MKSYKFTWSVLVGVAFLVGIVGLYYGATARVFMWLMLFPVKAAQYVAKDLLHLATEKGILFSLSVGIPLTVWYWWLLLRGFRPTVRR